MKNEDVRAKSLKKHYEWQGKIEVVARCPVETREDLSLAYTPGVAEPCLEIEKDPEKSYELTRRKNLVAVITDGTAILGLGDIGPEAGMPVMEGKCALFKKFADVDAFPLCIKTKDVDELVRTIYLLSGSFGGINLEDISAPRCFEVERRLKEICDIPVFHDDQHGTAVVVAAALLNALKVVNKEIGKVKVVINGAGSAGCAIGRHLLNLGVKDLTMVDRFGIICEGMEELNPAHKELSKVTNPRHLRGILADAMKGADVFIGVSAPGVVSKEMVASMAKDAIVFPMANPTPEIFPDEALKAGARIVGTGRSDYPNQINNVLAFPGIFRGALNCRAREINEEMKVAASMALAGLISDEERSETNIIPGALDPRVAPAVARAVADAARKTKVARE
ncbi:MAG: NADP-dependent malic enzyme [Clostridia bacterium]|nr:NADP-dependent malic enzyme [Clostridia bacterium]